MKVPRKLLGLSVAAAVIPGALTIGVLLFFFPSLRAWCLLMLTKAGLALGLVSAPDPEDDADDAPESSSPSRPGSSPDAPALAAQLGQVLPDSFAPVLQPIAEGVLGNIPDTGGLTPFQYGLLVAAMSQRESGGKAGSDAAPGDALKGSLKLQGDPGPRWHYGPPKWCARFPGCLTGQTKQGKKGTLYEITAPAFAGGDAGLWGFSKVQLDLESYIDSPDFAAGWQDDFWAFNEGANHLANSIDSLASIRDGVSSYNCGVGAARASRAAGNDPDLLTTGRNYAVDVIARANAWGANIPS